MRLPPSQLSSFVLVLFEKERRREEGNPTKGYGRFVSYLRCGELSSLCRAQQFVLKGVGWKCLSGSSGCCRNAEEFPNRRASSIVAHFPS